MFCVQNNAKKIAIKLQFKTKHEKNTITAYCLPNENMLTGRFSTANSKAA
jgi:hypothetical protein